MKFNLTIDLPDVSDYEKLFCINCPLCTKFIENAVCFDMTCAYTRTRFQSWRKMDKPSYCPLKPEEEVTKNATV